MHAEDYTMEEVHRGWIKGASVGSPLEAEVHVKCKISVQFLTFTGREFRIKF